MTGFIVTLCCSHEAKMALSPRYATVRFLKKDISRVKPEKNEIREQRIQRTERACGD